MADHTDLTPADLPPEVGSGTIASPSGPSADGAAPAETAEIAEIVAVVSSVPYTASRLAEDEPTLTRRPAAATPPPVTPPVTPPVVTRPLVTPPVTAPVTAPVARPKADWASEVADRIDDVVEKVRANTSDKLVSAARWVVFGLLAVVLGGVGVVLLVVFALRLLVVIFQGEVWLAHLVLGAIFLLLGVFLWSRRTAKPPLA